MKIVLAVEICNEVAMRMFVMMIFLLLMIV